MHCAPQRFPICLKNGRLTADRQEAVAGDPLGKWMLTRLSEMSETLFHDLKSTFRHCLLYPSSTRFGGGDYYSTSGTLERDQEASAFEFAFLLSVVITKSDLISIEDPGARAAWGECV